MKNLSSLRAEINQIDKNILNLISKRIRLASKIGLYKKSSKLPVQDKKREQEILANLLKNGKKYNLSPSLIKSTWDLLFKESYKKEK